MFRQLSTEALPNTKDVKDLELIGIPTERAKIYATIFEKNGMDELALSKATDEILKSIGIDLLGDRIKILEKYNYSDPRRSIHSKSSSSYDYRNELKDITIVEKINAGAFGEVFKGSLFYVFIESQEIGRELQLHSSDCIHLKQWNLILKQVY